MRKVAASRTGLAGTQLFWGTEGMLPCFPCVTQPTLRVSCQKKRWTPRSPGFASQQNYKSCVTKLPGICLGSDGCQMQPQNLDSHKTWPAVCQAWLTAKIWPACEQTMPAGHQIHLSAHQNWLGLKPTFGLLPHGSTFWGCSWARANWHCYLRRKRERNETPTFQKTIETCGQYFAKWMKEPGFRDHSGKLPPAGGSANANEEKVLKRMMSSVEKFRAPFSLANFLTKADHRNQHHREFPNALYLDSRAVLIQTGYKAIFSRVSSLCFIAPVSFWMPTVWDAFCGLT